MSNLGNPSVSHEGRVAVRVSVYVDGMNLYYGVRSTGELRNLWLDVWLLSQNLLRRGQSLTGVKYYTARFVSDGADERLVRQQDAHLDSLATIDGLEIVEGNYQRKPVRCNLCGNKWKSYEEKMTDVNIGVDLLCDAEDDAYDMALLITGDGDLTGPIARVLDRHPNKRVVVAFPPQRASEALMSVASAHFVIGRGRLRNSQLPDVVMSNDGYPLRRPAEWS